MDTDGLASVVVTVLRVVSQGTAGSKPARTPSTQGRRDSSDEESDSPSAGGEAKMGMWASAKQGSVFSYNQPPLVFLQ